MRVRFTVPRVQLVVLGPACPAPRPIHLFLSLFRNRLSLIPHRTSLIRRRTSLIPPVPLMPTSFLPPT